MTSSYLADNTPTVPRKVRADIFILVPSVVELLALSILTVICSGVQVQLAGAHVGNAEAFVGVRSVLALLVGGTHKGVGGGHAVRIEDLEGSRMGSMPAIMATVSVGRL